MTTRITQEFLGALASSDAAGRVTQEALLVMGIVTPPNRITQQFLSGVWEDPNTLPRISQEALLVLARPPHPQLMRAWTYTMDGHDFYVLQLQGFGTVVYDTTTERWSEWLSDDFNYWRANTGMNWDTHFVAGDTEEGTIWNLDPDANDDDGVPFTRIVTGGFAARLRMALPVNGVMITGSVGHHGGAVSITLKTSDDFGNTWHDHGQINTVVKGDFGKELAWRSLGTAHAPGRLFEIVDTGVAYRIDGMDHW